MCFNGTLKHLKFCRSNNKILKVDTKKTCIDKKRRCPDWNTFRVLTRNVLVCQWLDDVITSL